jgi:hypothetical protein
MLEPSVLSSTSLGCALAQCRVIGGVYKLIWMYESIAYVIAIIKVCMGFSSTTIGNPLRTIFEFALLSDSYKCAACPKK